MLCRGGDNVDLGSGIHVEGERTRIEQIFYEVQSTFLLDRVLEISIPGSICLDLCLVMAQMKLGEICVRFESRLTIPAFDVWIKRTVLVGRAVIIAKGDQRTNF